MADYVVSWPYQHFGENAMIPSFQDIEPCLPEAAVIYCQTGPAVTQFYESMLPHMTKKFVFVTGQSDYSPSQWAPKLLDHPLLIRWYAQNADYLQHPRMRALPIGINCYEHGPELSRFLQNHIKREPKHTDKLALVNFGLHTYQARTTLYELLCSASSQYSTFQCVDKKFENQIQNNAGLVGMHEEFSRYRFWVSPRGNGVDCHRTWEAMYAGSIPVVERTPLISQLYEEDMPVFVVDDVMRINDATIEAADAWAQNSTFRLNKLTSRYWIDRIRQDAAAVVGSETLIRHTRCWSIIQ